MALSIEAIMERIKQEEREAGIHHRQLTKILRENSSYPEAHLLSSKRLADEWYVIQSEYDVDAGLKCMCGKENIYWHHVIKNRFNGTLLDPIGSKCVKRFEIELLGITCMCCAKPLGESNPYLEAYMKYSAVKKDTLIVGHKNCAKKLFIEPMLGYILLPTAVISYFKNLGVSVKTDHRTSIEFEYEDERLTPYIDMISDF
jgi:hypothetical protein